MELRAILVLLSVCGICHGQFREMIGMAQEAATGFNGLSTEVVKEEVGTFIRTAHHDGCLDAGCCMWLQNQVRFNNDCPSWGWLKWSFNGPMLVVHRPFFHSCLDCLDGGPDCLIGSASCKGKHTQFWYLNDTQGLHNPRGETLFTIVSNLYPDRCITIDKASSNLRLRSCREPEDTQLFYITNDWIRDLKAAH